MGKTIIETFNSRIQVLLSVSFEVHCPSVCPLVDFYGTRQLKKSKMLRTK